MTLSITETSEGRKVTGYLAGDNSWLLPNEEIINIEVFGAYNLPLVNYDTPYWGTTTYVAWTRIIEPTIPAAVQPGTLYQPTITLREPVYGGRPYKPHIGLTVDKQSRVGRSLTSKPKTRGKKSPKQYKPLRGMKCRPGYKFVSVPGSEVGMCVKQ